MKHKIRIGGEGLMFTSYRLKAKCGCECKCVYECECECEFKYECEFEYECVCNIHIVGRTPCTQYIQ